MNDQINVYLWVQQSLTLGTLLLEHSVVVLESYGMVAGGAFGLLNQLRSLLSF